MTEFTPVQKILMDKLEKKGAIYWNSLKRHEKKSMEKLRLLNVVYKTTGQGGYTCFKKVNT